MSFLHHSLSIMYLFTLLSAFICIQLVITASGDSYDVSPNHQWKALHPETTVENPDGSNSNSESDEDSEHVRRSTSFLRFGRQMASPTGSFLRFGRSNPSFLRFGRGVPNGATFLRFGRRAQRSSPANFLRYGRKGEFLRFG